VQHTTERGVALVWAVATVGILASLAMTVGRRSVGARNEFWQITARAQGDALLRSGVTLASVAIEAHLATGAPDTLRAPWAAPQRQRVGTGWLEVHVEDLGRRIDVDAETLRPVLARLAAQLDLPIEVPDSLADWVDPDDDPRPRGAEAEWYEHRIPALRPANGPFTSIHHLAFVRGVTPTVLDRLAPYVSAGGQPGLNPNTASPAVLEAWLGDPVRVARILATRDETTIDCVGLRHCMLRSRRFLVHVRATVGPVDRAADVTILAAPGLQSTIERWEPPFAGSRPGGDEVGGGDRLAELP